MRLRREYLYRKSLEGKERAEYEKKAAVREALREGKPLPTELKGQVDALREKIAAEDDESSRVRSHIDDEYAEAGLRDPKVGR